MNRSQVHLWVNVGFSLVLAGLAVTGVWVVFSGMAVRVCLGTAVFVGWLFFAHRVSPHMTGGLVAWLCDRLGIDP